jgi:hypothetical protein
VTEPTRAEPRSPAASRRPDDQRSAYALKHQRFGWWSLLLFATLGLILELLHGFKIQMYLSVSNETRRLMWTLAHAHGVLLAVVNIIFGLSLTHGRLPIRSVPRISLALIAASILLPGGFFAGGVQFYEGDPGLGIIVVPVGAAVLLLALFSIAQEVGRCD